MSWPTGRRTSISYAKSGMLFTDYYAEASCTAGRANFITGVALRTGMTTSWPGGVPRSACRSAAPTIATVLKSMGYATGQFGENHLGDLNEILPTVHGLDEFFGYLYHLDAMEDPSQPVTNCVQTIPGKGWNTLPAPLRAARRALVRQNLAPREVGAPAIKRCRVP